MKVVFLDVDGVLNIISNSYYSTGYGNLGNDPIERHLMVRLEFILERVPDLRIVISSSWTNQQLINKLRKCRFKYIDRIIGRTPRKHKWRGLQIQDWLFTHDVSKYIVLEDEPSDVCGDKFSVIPECNVVHVDMNEGLSDKDTIKAIKILMFTKEMSFPATEQMSLDVYNKYVKLGFRPHVIGTPDELVNRWSWFKVDTENLMLHMMGNKEKV